MLTMSASISPSFMDDVAAMIHPQSTMVVNVLHWVANTIQSSPLLLSIMGVLVTIILAYYVYVYFYYIHQSPCHCSMCNQVYNHATKCIDSKTAAENMQCGHIAAQSLHATFENMNNPSPITKGLPFEYTPDKIRDHYDIVIMGGGVAGLTQAMHLTQRMKGLSICVIDRRDVERTDVTKHRKVGESTVFVSATFMARELGLQQYLLENHCLKYALQYHWAKSPDTTATWDDFYHIQTLRLPYLLSYQVDRSKLERDLISMLRDRGVHYYQGLIQSIKTAKNPLNLRQEPHIVMCHDVDHDGNVIPSASLKSITCEHLVDAAGSRFLLGSMEKCIIRDPQELYDIRNGSIWFRVRNMNDELFTGGHDGGTTTASWYYATNHFIGPGYWIWVIPIEGRHEHGRDVSIGVTFHSQVYEASQFIDLSNPKDPTRFLNFLKANQTMLYNWISSGSIVDVQHLTRIAHYSTNMITPNRWYILGESSYNVDPFYSTGMSVISQQVPLITEVIASQRSGDRDVLTKIRLYNEYLMNTQKSLIHQISRHWKHLGNASTMSWRIFKEVAYGTPGIIGYFTHYPLKPCFAAGGPKAVENKIWYFNGVYDLMDEAIDKGINVGFMDYNEPGGLTLFGYGESTIFDTWNIDGLLEHQLGSTLIGQFNLPKCQRFCLGLTLGSFLTLAWRVAGIKGFLGLSHQRIIYPRILYLLKSLWTAHLNTIRHAWQWRNVRPNTKRAQEHEGFKSYQYTTKVIPW